MYQILNKKDLVAAHDECGHFSLKGMLACFFMNMSISTTVCHAVGATSIRRTRCRIENVEVLWIMEFA
jgi:hypothetical protein